MPARPKIDLVEGSLTEIIIGAFYTVYNYFGFGLLESIYKIALEIELRLRGHRVDREVPVAIEYKGHLIRKQRIDMVVDRKVIVEVKAQRRLSPDFEQQVNTQLKASEFEVALLLHFGPRPDTHRFYMPNRTKPRQSHFIDQQHAHKDEREAGDHARRDPLAKEQGPP